MTATALRAEEEEPVVLDFRHAHDLQIVRDAGIISREFPDGFATLEVEHLRLLFPGDNEIEMRHVDHASVKFKESGELESLNIQGGNLPAEVAGEIVRRIHSAYGPPVSGVRLDDWLEKTRGKEWSGGVGSHLSVFKDFYPVIDVEITSAVNRLYPWKLSVSLSWRNAFKGTEGRDEAWGWENNPRPPEELRRVSLNPADGRQYDPMDAYRDLAGRQKALDQKLGQVRGPDGRLIRVEKPPLPMESQTTGNAMQKRSIWLFLAPLLAAVAVLVVLGRRWLTRAK